ncbi:unnamed protein product [Rhizopus stolonifer]
MDSDLEDQIMSHAYYTPGLEQKKVTDKPIPTKEQPKVKQPKQPKPKTIHAPIESRVRAKSGFSAADELHLVSDEDDDREDGEYISISGKSSESSEDEIMVEVPKVTRTINLDDNHDKDLDVEMSSEDEFEDGDEDDELIKEAFGKKDLARQRSHYTRVEDETEKDFYDYADTSYCSICLSPGHDQMDCYNCRSCGSDEHSTRDCIATEICRNCRVIGHGQDCPYTTKPLQCATCNSTFHITENCLLFNHDYLDRNEPTQQIEAYCYSCADRGHYGDDCSTFNRKMKSVPSVFSTFVAFGKMVKVKNNKSSSRSGKRTASEHEDTFSPEKRYKRKNTFESSHIKFGREIKYDHPKDRSSSSSPFMDSDTSVSSKSKQKGKFNNYDDKKKGKSYNYDYKSKGKNTNYGGSSYKGSSSKGKAADRGGSSRGGSNALSQFFQPEKKSYNFTPTGNSNWNAINQGSLPQPTRSGTYQFDQRNKGGYNSNKNNSKRNGKEKLPKPSKSGVIDLT